MKADVPFDYFVNKSIHRASACNQDMKNRAAVCAVFQGSLDRIDLSSHPTAAIQQLLFISGNMRHLAYTIPRRVYETNAISPAQLQIDGAETQ